MHIDMRLDFRGWVVTLGKRVRPVLSRALDDFGCLSRFEIFISDQMIFWIILFLVFSKSDGQKVVW